MSREDDFEKAQVTVKALPKTPTSAELLELYGWYKQATLGDVEGARPGMMDFKGRAKFDAWLSRKGADREAAMAKYVEVVERLSAKYGR